MIIVTKVRYWPNGLAPFVRVIEMPTPRWIAYDAKRLGVKVSKEVPITTQQYAYV